MPITNWLTSVNGEYGSEAGTGYRFIGLGEGKRGWIFPEKGIFAGFQTYIVRYRKPLSIEILTQDECVRRAAEYDRLISSFDALSVPNRQNSPAPPRGMSRVFHEAINAFKAYKP